MEHCWREDTVDIVSKTRILQQYIEDAGGFEGEGGVPVVRGATGHMPAVAGATRRKLGRSGGAGMPIPGDVDGSRDDDDEGGIWVCRRAGRGDGMDAAGWCGVATAGAGVRVVPRGKGVGGHRDASGTDGMGDNMLVNKNRGVSKV
jgi:hypothetical protein